MENIVGFDNISVPARLRRGDEETEADVSPAYAGRCLNELCDVVRHSRKKHRVKFVHVDPVGYGRRCNNISQGLVEIRKLAPPLMPPSA